MKRPHVPRKPGTDGLLSVPDRLLFLAGVALPFAAASAAALDASIGIESWLTLALLGSVAGAPASRRLTVQVENDNEGRPRAFTLGLANERTVLEPGKSWSQTDRFKWVTRGVIEAPQSFAVRSDGTVDLNGETHRPTDPEGARALEVQINKRHGPPAPPKPKAAAPQPSANTSSDRVHFKVRLDHLGHLMVEARRGTERTETGLRGLGHLALDGWMKRPAALHIDPLQRYLELDGTRFDCDSEGARHLEHQLNAHYAPIVAAEGGAAIEVRENPAAATGFDIHFWTVRAGARFEIKGHLAQDKLDILQDRDKCDLLQPGTILRMAPPYLYIRRRRPDGGEDRIPELPDVKYRAIRAADLQRLLNHPLIRSRPAGAEPSTDGGHEPIPAPGPPPDLARLPEPLPEPPRPPPVSAASPQPTASQTPLVAPPASFPAPERSPPRTLDAGALPPPRRPPGTPPAHAAPEPALTPADPARLALFAEIDPHEIHDAIFRQLTERVRVPLQDLLLSLPRVFEDRRFEILSFNQQEISSVLELRSDRFYGFYLTHIGPERIDLVYACRGTHIEWGTDKCALQPAAGAETHELRTTALRGLAQDRDNHFVFLVEPRYREWVRPHEKACAEALAHFLTVEEWARNPDDFPLIWP